MVRSTDSTPPLPHRARHSKADDEGCGSRHHNSTLWSIPLRLMTKSLVLVRSGTMSRTLASSPACCCGAEAELASPWPWLALELWSSVSMNSCRAASQFSWKALREVFRYTPIPAHACASTQISRKT